MELRKIRDTDFLISEDGRKKNTYTNFEFSYKCPTTMADECKPVESSDSKRCQYESIMR